jgi:hypothetical protein
MARLGPGLDPGALKVVRGAVAVLGLVLVWSGAAQVTCAQSTSSPQVRANGRVFKHTPRRIPNILARTTGDIALETATTFPHFPFEYGDQAYLGNILCKSPLIATGLVGPPQFFLTEDEGGIFSAQPFEVSEILLNGTDATINAGTTITLLQDGGELVIDGRRVRQLNPADRQLAIGRPYLVVFDTYVPETGAFATYPIAFSLVGPHLETTSRAVFGRFDGRPPSDMLALMRDATARLPHRCVG